MKQKARKRQQKLLSTQPKRYQLSAPQKAKNCPQKYHGTTHGIKKAV